MEESAGGHPRNADIFALGNLVLFIVSVSGAVVATLAGYRPVGSIPEFLIYGCSILAVIGLCWFFLRQRPCGVALLLLVEIGLLAHFAGAFVPVGGRRLYEIAILGIRFDHYVHIFNAFAAGALIDHFLGAPAAIIPARRLLVACLVLGAGSVVEMIEYLAFLTVPDAGVGGYDNNMQDLFANLIGALAYLVVTGRRRPRHERPARG